MVVEKGPVLHFDMGWELAAWVAGQNARKALALALTATMRDGQASPSRAEEIARMIMRTNTGRLYKLDLK